MLIYNMFDIIQLLLQGYPDLPFDQMLKLSYIIHFAKTI